MRHARLLALQGKNETLGIQLGHFAFGQSLVKISRVQDDLALELLTLYLGQQDFLELLSHQQQSTILYVQPMPIIGICIFVIWISVHHLGVGVEGGILISEALVAIVVGHTESMLYLVHLHSVVQGPFLQLRTPIHLQILIAEVTVENRVRPFHRRKPLYGDLHRKKVT